MEAKQTAIEKYNFSDQMLIRHLKEVQATNYSKERAQLMSQLFFEAQSLAEFGLFLNKNILDIKHLFYLAALADQQSHLFWQAAIEKGEVDMAYEKAHIRNVSSTISYGLLCGILSDNWSFCQEFARNRESITPVEYKDLLLCAQTMFHLLLEEEEVAKSKLILLKNLKKISGQITSYVLVLEGILFKQSELVEQGLKKQISLHKRVNSYSILYSTSLTATMLAKLASRYSIYTPAFESPFIHKGLLKNQQDISYSNSYAGLEFLL